jgi:hypothetical protein
MLKKTAALRAVAASIARSDVRVVGRAAVA